MKANWNTKSIQSLRAKIVMIMSVVIIFTIFFVVIANFLLSESLYLYSKRDDLIEVYNILKTYNQIESGAQDIELERLSLKNNFDIAIRTSQNIIIYTSNKNFLNVSAEFTEFQAEELINSIDKKDILYTKENINIIRINDSKTGLDFMMLIAKLDNGNEVYIRMPISFARTNSDIANRTLWIIAGMAMLIGAVVTIIISKKIAKPVLELNNIAKSMSNLNFDKKYRVRDTEDEINDLGKSINIMSDKLEDTIKELRRNNSKLERDVEEKAKINELRSQFISDVSHELKTPIALIQGYAEGLVENVAGDEESRKYYAEIILDETNKMDRLVKQLLELSKLEHQVMKFNNAKFDIVEMITETVRKSKVLIEEGNIEIEILQKEPMIVDADEFYIEQVVTNYLTNAIHHVKEVNGKKKIEIRLEKVDDKIKVSVFNTGDKIEEENIQRIWNRFFKVDSSRKREGNGTGIGLSLVKAIMNNYGNDFGLSNKEDGVEFYFVLNTENIK